MDTFANYQKAFTEKAFKNGFSADEVNKCLTYAKLIIQNGLPIIYNTSHLSALVGYNKKYLKRASAYTSYFYKQHKIPKKNKSIRILNEPLPSLKEIQHWILKNILNKIQISRYTKSYTSGRNIKDHVKYHKGQDFVLTLDIKDFFGNIKYTTINQLFFNLGYSTYVSSLLAKLCCLDDSLPQGAPTSPRLSNIILKSFDNDISEYCKINNLRYSRYADDLAFSGNSIEKEKLTHLIEKKLDSISSCLKLNVEKTMLMRKNQRQVISGIIVNDKIQVPKARRDELRQAIFFIDKYGLDDHLKHINFNKGNYIKHLLGIANYIVFINPKDEKTIEIRRKLYEMIK